VGLDGRVGRAEPISGLPSLRDPAIDLAKHYVYRPVIVNGDPVEVEFAYTVTFCKVCQPQDRALQRGNLSNRSIQPSGAPR
jgi:hypothetical protein